MSILAKSMLNAEGLRTLVEYDPENGKMVWLERPITIFPTARSCAVWNSRFSGKAAFQTANSHGYLVSTILGRLYTAHRVAWCIMEGQWPFLQVDHINGDRKDNRWSNLRAASNSTNHKNQKMPRTNTSGTVGIHQDKRTGSWVAQIYDNGRRINLGTFADKQHAIAARLKAEMQFGYHPNHGRENA